MRRYLRFLVSVIMLSAVFYAPGRALAQNESWTGWYGGAHGGYRWLDADFSGAAYAVGIIPFPGHNESYDLDSAIVGLQLGHNWLNANNRFFGIEGDFTWGWGDDSQTTSGGGLIILQQGELEIPFSIREITEVEANWQATLRARFGWVDGPWLYYATAGIAWMDVDWKDSISVITAAVPLNLTHSKNFTMTGFVAGAGVEKELNNPLWRARLEFLYEAFGDENVPFGATSPAQIGKLDIDDVFKLRVAINRKFGN